MKLCGFDVGLHQPFFLIAGTCSIEGLEMSIEVAGRLKEACTALGIPLIYKGSFDKANRSSGNTQRGVGLDAGLKILDEVRRQIGVPILTDVHDESQVKTVASVVDVLQTPAFLCRQTDFIRAVAQSGKPVNIKKGQFLAPWDMAAIAKKAVNAGNDKILLCERGTTFGYHDLVVDFRSLIIMKETGLPVIYDATHSLQQPGGGEQSGGLRQYIAPLAKAAVACGIDGIFIETHPYPQLAKSDSATQFPLNKMRDLLHELADIHSLVSKS
jgi:2-dehydro-3-deoxyphosphooctonate aldolase (KDO 8-P synthase)